MEPRLRVVLPAVEDGRRNVLSVESVLAHAQVHQQQPRGEGQVARRTGKLNIVLSIAERQESFTSVLAGLADFLMVQLPFQLH